MNWSEYNWWPESRSETGVEASLKEAGWAGLRWSTSSINFWTIWRRCDSLGGKRRDHHGDLSTSWLLFTGPGPVIGHHQADETDVNYNVAPCYQVYNNNNNNNNTLSSSNNNLNLPIFIPLCHLFQTIFCIEIFALAAVLRSAVPRTDNWINIFNNERI